MDSLLTMVLSLSLSGSLLFFAVLGVTRLGQRKFSKAWQYYAWLLVALRLLVPVTTSVSLVGSLFAQPPRVALSQEAPASNVQQEGLSVPLYANGAAMYQLTDHGQASHAGASHAVQWLCALWLAVALMLAAHKVIRYRHFVSRVCTGHGAVSDPELLARLKTICQKLGIRSQVDLYESRQVPCPLVVDCVVNRIMV